MLVLVILAFCLLSEVPPAWAQDASVQAKQFPTGHFYQYHKISIPEKEKVLARIDATLQKLTGEGYCLIAKGAVIEKPDPTVRIYPKLTILDESGLLIIARQVPNLYYGYPGKTGLNPNIYIIVKHPRVNVPESFIRYGYVVEGDFQAYASKFVNAIMQGLERPGASPVPQPAPPPT